MPSENDLVELLHAIGDRAPDADHTLDVLSPRLRTAAPSNRARRVLAVAAAVVTVAGVGIGSTVVLRGGGDTNTAAGYADAEPTTNHETYELPLDRYHASAVQERTLQRAQYVYAQRCSRDAGLAVPTLDVPAANPAAKFLNDFANDVRPLTVGQARRLGYESYPGADLPINPVYDKFDTRQRDAYDRCDTAADRTLLRGTTPAKVPDLYEIDKSGREHPVRDDDNYVHNVYVNEAWPLWHTAAVRHAQNRWSACMADHGYPGLDSTTSAIQRQRGSHSAAAKRQAVQDVKCKEATGFMTVWVDALRDAQRTVIARHRTALAGFEERLKIRLANAARVLGQP